MDYDAIIPRSNDSVPSHVADWSIARIIDSMLSDQQSVSVSAPVLEVLKAASVELRELRDRQMQLTKRIRTVRSTMTALQNLRQVRQNPADPLERQLMKRMAEGNEPDQELRRACRIAMLESPEGLTKEEVLARIVRRGSYHFANVASAKTVIRKELNAMVEEGELECEACESGWKWKRIAESPAR